MKTEHRPVSYTHLDVYKRQAQNLVLENKYQEHLKEMAEGAKVEIPDEQALLQAVKDALEGKS